MAKKDFHVVVDSHLDELKLEFIHKVPAIMEAIGLQAEGNAIKEITKMKAVDTGRLRNSITFATTTAQGSPNGEGGEPALPSDYNKLANPEFGTMYIGTNVEYAPYIEYGARKMKGRPFLRNAITNYSDQYKDILEKGLRDN